MRIEYISVYEQLTRSWAKFYVRGLEGYVEKGAHERNHDERYQRAQYYIGDVPNGIVFSILAQTGDRLRTETFRFWIAVTDEHAQRVELAVPGWINGTFRIVAQADNKIKGPRLRVWWASRPNEVDPLVYAEHCARYIQHAVKTLPPLEQAVGE